LIGRARVAQSVRAGQVGFGCSIPGGGWEFFPSPPRPDRLWGPTKPPIKWQLGALFRG